MTSSAVIPTTATEDPIPSGKRTIRGGFPRTPVILRLIRRCRQDGDCWAAASSLATASLTWRWCWTLLIVLVGGLWCWSSS